MQRDQIRIKAMQDLAEALRVGAPPAQPAAQPGAQPPQQGALQGTPPPQPQGPPPQQGALSASGPGGMPQQRPAMSPLQSLPSFRSPPVQAALQGAEGIKGHPALNRPVGFARGGFVVRR